MERTPMTKEEIALELIKLITAPATSGIAYIDANAEKIGNAYNKVLATISTSEKK